MQRSQVSHAPHVVHRHAPGTNADTRPRMSAHTLAHGSNTQQTDREMCRCVSLVGRGKQGRPIHINSLTIHWDTEAHTDNSLDAQEPPGVPSHIVDTYQVIVRFSHARGPHERQLQLQLQLQPQPQPQPQPHHTPWCMVGRHTPTYIYIYICTYLYIYISIYIYTYTYRYIYMYM